MSLTGNFVGLYSFTYWMGMALRHCEENQYIGTEETLSLPTDVYWHGWWRSKSLNYERPGLTWDWQVLAQVWSLTVNDLSRERKYKKLWFGETFFLGLCVLLSTVFQDCVCVLPGIVFSTTYVLICATGHIFQTKYNLSSSDTVCHKAEYVCCFMCSQKRVVTGTWTQFYIIDPLMGWAVSSKALFVICSNVALSIRLTALSWPLTRWDFCSSLPLTGPSLSPLLPPFHFQGRENTRGSLVPVM